MSEVTISLSKPITAHGAEVSELTLREPTGDDVERCIEAIIKAAEQKACDLIFMASHGRSGIGHLLLSSVTEKVLRHTKIPVLVHR